MGQCWPKKRKEPAADTSPVAPPVLRVTPPRSPNFHPRQSFYRRRDYQVVRVGSPSCLAVPGQQTASSPRNFICKFAFVFGVYSLSSWSKGIANYIRCFSNASRLTCEKAFTGSLQPTSDNLFSA